MVNLNPQRLADQLRIKACVLLTIPYLILQVPCVLCGRGTNEVKQTVLPLVTSTLSEFSIRSRSVGGRRMSPCTLGLPGISGCTQMFDNSILQKSAGRTQEQCCEANVCQCLNLPCLCSGHLSWTNGSLPFSCCLLSTHLLVSKRKDEGEKEGAEKQRGMRKGPKYDSTSYPSI